MVRHAILPLLYLGSTRTLDPPEELDLVSPRTSLIAQHLEPKTTLPYTNLPASDLYHLCPTLRSLYLLPIYQLCWTVREGDSIHRHTLNHTCFQMLLGVPLSLLSRTLPGRIRFGILLQTKSLYLLVPANQIKLPTYRLPYLSPIASARKEQEVIDAIHPLLTSMLLQISFLFIKVRYVYDYHY